MNIKSASGGSGASITREEFGCSAGEVLRA